MNFSEALKPENQIKWQPLVGGHLDQMAVYKDLYMFTFSSCARRIVVQYAYRELNIWHVCCHERGVKRNIPMLEGFFARHTENALEDFRRAFANDAIKAYLPQISTYARAQNLESGWYSWDVAHNKIVQRTLYKDQTLHLPEEMHVEEEMLLKSIAVKRMLNAQTPIMQNGVQTVQIISGFEGVPFYLAASAHAQFEYLMHTA